MKVSPKEASEDGCVGALQTGTSTNVFLVPAFDHHPADLKKQLAALSL